MPSNLICALGTVLRDARRSQGLSQESLASAVGLHRNTIGMIERAEIAVAADTLEGICIAVGLAPWEVLLEADFRQRT